MRLCVFVWSALTLPVLGELNPGSLCEEATSACVRWPARLRSHLCVFTCILCVFLELRASLLTGSVCVSGRGWAGGGDSGPFETDIRSESGSEAARERASFMWLCIPPRHSQAEAQDKTCVPPTAVTPPPHPTITTTPALPSLSSLHPSPLSVTLTFIEKPHAGIPFQHLCVDARVQHIHVNTHLHTCTRILVETLHGLDLTFIV